MKLLFSDFDRYSPLVDKNVVEVIDMIEGACIPGAVIIFMDYQIATMAKTATDSEILVMSIFKGLFLDKLSSESDPRFKSYNDTFNTLYHI